MLYFSPGLEDPPDRAHPPSALSRQRARADLDSGVASGESDYTSHCGLSQYVSL